MSSTTSEEEENSEVIEIASDILNTDPKKVPYVLKKLKNILDQYEDDREQLMIVQRTIWKYDLLNWCVNALCYDYNTVIREQMELFRGIVKVLFECCYAVNIEESEEFATSSLPLAIETSLLLMRQLQQTETTTRIRKFPQARMLRDDLLAHMYKIIGRYPYLSSHLISSPHLLRLITEHEQAPQLATKLIQITTRAVQVGVIGGDKERHRQHIGALMDELVYKLTSSSDEQIARASAKLLLTIARHHREQADDMKHRYRGLKVILKRWEGRDSGLDDDLVTIGSYLETAKPKPAVPRVSAAEKEKHDHGISSEKLRAAEVIWAHWQGYKVRRQMSALKRTVVRLQTAVRYQQREARERGVEVRLERLQRDMQRGAEREFARKRNQERMNLLQIIPSEQFDSHLRKEREMAAVKIQSGWKSFVQRRNYESMKDELKRHKAARVIQKAVRKFLKMQKLKRQSAEEIESLKRENTSWLEPIDDKRRKELEVKIMQWQAVHKRFGVSDDEVLENHRKAQSLLTKYHRMRYDETEERRKSDYLMARLHLQQDVLQHLPKLDEASREDVDRLASSSNMVRIAAQIEHSKKMREISLPWWKRLSKDDDVDLSPDAEDLFA